MKKDYERFGPEWEKEMMKLTKKILIMMLRDEYIKNMDKKQTGNHKSPFGIGA